MAEVTAIRSDVGGPCPTGTLPATGPDLHGEWQGLWIEPDERRSFVTYSDRRALYEVGEELSGSNFGKRRGAIYSRIRDKTKELET